MTRARWAVVAAVMACGGYAWPAEPPMVVDLRDRAVVAGERIELGEVATISGPEEEAARLRLLDLGPAPLLGDSRALSLGYLKIRLRRWGVDLDAVVFGGSAEVRVSRPAAPAASAEVDMATPGGESAPAAPPVTVKRGSKVRLEVALGAVLIVATATTLEDGVVGGVVRMRVDQTRREVWARLRSPTQAGLEP